MADEQQAKPSFRHAVAKKALGPLVASAATAAATYLMRKGTEFWQETLQPKLEEKGGAEAVAREAVEKVSSKLAPASDAVTSKVANTEVTNTDRPKTPARTRSQAAPDGDRSEERRKREQRRRQRRKALEQSGSS